MITMRDVVQLAETTSDGYGDKTVNILADVDALFLQHSGSVHNRNTDQETSDAHVYLDINNSILLEKGYRIEGMYIIADPFGSDMDKAWFRVDRVLVGQRKLINNAVDNVHAFLRKVAPLEIQDVS